MDAPAVRRPALVAGLRLLRLVGSGGEGEVWEARDERGRRRALKLIRPDALADDAEARSRYLLRIDHAALVHVQRGGRLSGGDLDGWGFLEMDFVDGQSLHDAPPDPAVLDRLWPLAEALDLLHAGAWSDGLPLVHRDVKPANLVLTPDDELVLVDPSTLRGLDATQLTRIGTPVFSAPEVMSGRIGPAADVYSFAATVVALLTGARGTRLANVIDEVEQLDLPDGVRLALSPHPGDRPPTCLAVLQAGSILADDPTVLLPTLDGWAQPIEVSDDEAVASQVWDEPKPRPTVDATRRYEPWPEAREPIASRPVARAPAFPAPPPLPPPPRSPWGWTLLLLVLVALPAGVLALEALAPDVLRVLDRDMLPIAALAIVAAHLVAHAAARRPLLLALFAPPVAWAFLLADRAGGPRLRRAWTWSVLTGATMTVTAAPVLAVTQPEFGRSQAAAVLVFGLGLVVLGVAAVSARGFAGLLLRVLLLPAWAAGAVVVAVAAVLLAPFAATLRVATATLASIVEVARSPRRL